MSAPIKPTDSWQHDDIDMIIDVRAPAEFADDHIIGAVNLPVLDDAERAEVGTLYKQVSPFVARKRGAALVSQNIARHLAQVLKDKPADFRPLVHCWRGGQRSRSMATILAEIGWPCYLLNGGYKAYRAEVMRALEVLPARFQLRIIGGPTGTAKTRLLHIIAEKGGQILDLEGLAAHKGSLLGADPHHPQPSQRLFESRLYASLSALAPDKPVYIEAESAKIGNVQIPKSLWRGMSAAPSVSLSAPLSARVAYLLEDYPHLTAQPDLFTKLVEGMRHRHGRDCTDKWAEYIDRQDWPALAAALLSDHYDPAYHRSAARHERPHSWALEMTDCTAPCLHQAAEQILKDACWAR